MTAILAARRASTNCLRQRCSCCPLYQTGLVIFKPSTLLCNALKIQFVKLNNYECSNANSSTSLSYQKVQTMNLVFNPLRLKTCRRLELEPVNFHPFHSYILKRIEFTFIQLTLLEQIV